MLSPSQDAIAQPDARKSLAACESLPDGRPTAITYMNARGSEGSLLLIETFSSTRMHVETVESFTQVGLTSCAWPCDWSEMEGVEPGLSRQQLTKT
jgi:hypothetical protein